jgi:thioredoxin reductase (NADPH)
MKEYDVVIIGSGPAGLTAGLYCGRARLNTIVLEKNELGGQMPNIYSLENWPGTLEGIPGAELAGNALAQVMSYEVGVQSQVAVQGIDVLPDGRKEVRTNEDTCLAKAVIIAGGTRPREVCFDGYDEYLGKSIHFCVMCDGAPYAGKDIAIIGGGDSGVSGALYMNRLRCRITQIEATGSLNASPILREQLKGMSDINVVCSTVAESLRPNGDRLTLGLCNTENDRKTTVDIDGLFILAGRDPETDYLEGTVDLDDRGFVKVDLDMETSRPGIYAAGDVRSRSAMQVITASGDGATAAVGAMRYINGNRWERHP